MNMKCAVVDIFNYSLEEMFDCLLFDAGPPNMALIHLAVFMGENEFSWNAVDIKTLELFIRRLHLPIIYYRLENNF